MEKSYDRFLTSLRVYDPKMTEEQRLILRMARLFGECELAVPSGFLAEVQNYIRKWQSSPRLKNAVQTAQSKGYTRRIADELLAQNLPPQFFYLALQESNFDAYISGPPTRMGIAKGMWQFIPETGAKYGLTIGPFSDSRRPDTADDRHNWEKATNAAARYLKDIYSTDAQASGLLVMASYNWGEDRVIRQIRSMPANPRERNFWRLLIDHRDKLPNETYDYVFYIFSAAVIGENPFSAFHSETHSPIWRASKPLTYAEYRRMFPFARSKSLYRFPFRRTPGPPYAPLPRPGYYGRQRQRDPSIVRRARYNPTLVSVPLGHNHQGMRPSNRVVLIFKMLDPVAEPFPGSL
ncbi:MAG: lytic transglycosylase domain-containing protein [Bryobacteraceae bacterium]